MTSTGPETGNPSTGTNTPFPTVNTTVTTMTTTSTALSDQLPGSIPRLEPSGLNWAIFSLRFQDAMEAKGFWGHFDGTEDKPVPTDANAITMEEKAEIALWDKNERLAKSLLTQKLPDSALMRIRNKK